MFGGKIGMWELLAILAIVLVLFGANKLPQLGAGLGQSIRGFKKALSGEDEPKPPASTPQDPSSPRERSTFPHDS
jgi:sec-independent protein translocase protein TatA